MAEGAISSDNPSSLQTCDVSGPTPTVKNTGRVVTDGVEPTAALYMTTFPYLNTPIPGSPNGPTTNGLPADGQATQ